MAFVFLAITFSGCSRGADDASFSSRLKKIDSFLVSGRDVKARKALASLRKDAKSASNWLSIAKRERGLRDFRAAARTLDMAMKALPSSDGIIACRMDTLLELGSVDEALELSARLERSTYPALISYAEISKALSAGAAYPAPEAYIDGYRVTGNPDFRRNAAVLLAASGRFSEALALTDAVSTTDNSSQTGEPAPIESVFWALLSYDAGDFDRVMAFFPDPSDPLLDFERFSLLADAAWLGGDKERARSAWLEMISRMPDVSPIPYYDIALTALESETTRASLIRCTELFPAWYPAVARIVRSVGYAGNEPSNPNNRDDADDPDDPVKKTLRSAGFLSLGMEASLHDGRFTEEDATTTLARALAAIEKGGDVRLRLEELRFGLSRDGNAVRSSSLMWNLIEAYRDNPVLYRYATWFFAVEGDFGTAFSINRASPNGPDPFYLGLEAAARQDLTTAESEFSKIAASETDSWAALGNIARIAAKAGDYARAEESVGVAAGLAPNDRVKSRLIGESGEYLVALHDLERARKVFAYACDLDPSNYEARARLRALEAGE